MTKRKIKIGTRNSKLALWQAYYVQNLLKKNGMDSEIVTIETKENKILDIITAKIGSKGVFTEEIEDMLQLGEIDIAVHSAKDMPSILPEGLKLIAFGEREKVNDVLVSHQQNLNIKKDNLTIGTFSTRRIAFLKKYYPHLQTVPIRGNLQTRIKKMKEGVCDALLLAYAGIHRMEFDDMIIHEFDKEKFVPAVGQGSIAIEVHESFDMDLSTRIRTAINHTASEISLLAERAYLRVMNGGCSIPIFGLAKIKGNNMILKGGIISLDGQMMVIHQISESIKNPEKVGEKLARFILKNGGRKILEKIRKEQG